MTFSDILFIGFTLIDLCKRYSSLNKKKTLKVETIHVLKRSPLVEISAAHINMIKRKCIVKLKAIKTQEKNAYGLIL